MNELLNADCLFAMSLIEDKSIDLVLTDPPYGTTACKWDSVIPFEPMWKELKRIRKDNAAIVLFGSEPFSSHLRMSNIKEFKYDWVWTKNRPSGIGYAKYRPMSYHEIISVFGFPKNNFYPQRIERSESGKNRVSYGHKHGLQKDCGVHSGFNFKKLGFKKHDQNTKNPSTVLYFNKEVGHHPTQKPVPLLEYLIKTYTLEGETVLDFTMGSGSTGVACKNLNRKFIGIEKDERYFEIAKRRINE